MFFNAPSRERREKRFYFIFSPNSPADYFKFRPRSLFCPLIPPPRKPVAGGRPRTIFTFLDRMTINANERHGATREICCLVRNETNSSTSSSRENLLVHSRATPRRRLLIIELPKRVPRINNARFSNPFYIRDGRPKLVKIKIFVDDRPFLIISFVHCVDVRVSLAIYRKTIIIIRVRRNFFGKRVLLVGVYIPF